MNSTVSTAGGRAAGRASPSNARLGHRPGRRPGHRGARAGSFRAFVAMGRGQRGAVVTFASSAYGGNPGGNRVKRGKDGLDPRNTTPPRAEQSALVNREVVLFLLQLELDSKLQRALTYDRFDEVKELRDARNKVDGALGMMQTKKGYGCGTRRAMRSEQFGTLAPSALSIRANLSRAIEEEDYAKAAELRDQLAALEEQSAEANMLCPVGEPEFGLGQVVIHSTKGYRGVICGWDFCCCEDDVWKRTNNAGSLENGTDQVFYHVLVDVADWPMDFASMGDELDAPVAYVAEELLDEITLADFDSDEPLVNTPFQHPYSYLMFLGTNGSGNMIPCRQLRERYDVERTVDRSGEDSDEDWDDLVDDTFQSEEVVAEARGEALDGLPVDEDADIVEEDVGLSNRAAGINSIPGIDMRSLSSDFVDDEVFDETLGDDDLGKDLGDALGKDLGEDLGEDLGDAPDEADDAFDFDD